METAPLKSFATWARTALIREVTARITVVLAPASPERVEQLRRVEALEKAVDAAGGGAEGRAAVADRVAYTWFNRIIALRFMDANGYTGIGVVSPQAGVASGQPEILAGAKRGQFDTDVIDRRTRETVAGLLDGTRRSADPQGESYALLLVSYCRHWNRSMPFMFQREGDFTELLIPANLLADESVLSRAVKALTGEVCKDVEVIGWLYQFYISERKDEVFAGFKKNKKAGADEIPAATQLFTPHWIVRYLVENSLGRLWMLNRPSSRLAHQMDYYISPVAETDFLKIDRPEDLKIIDPACGSGHMLTYAFDLLYVIYEEEGYAPSEIPGLILANNLYGTEIDPRAGALAAFALTMKSRARHRTFFNKRVEPNVCVLEPILFTPQELSFLASAAGNRDEERDFWNQFEHVDTFGSLIQPDPKATTRFRRHLSTLDDGGDLLSADVIRWADRVVIQAYYLASQYSVVITNPPYMGSGNMNPQLAEFAKREYSKTKSDLFSMFIERASALASDLGYVGMITMQSWMFLRSHELLRREMLDTQTIVGMAHLGAGAFDTIAGEVVSTTAFVLRQGVNPKIQGVFVRLTDVRGEAAMSASYLSQIAEKDTAYLASATDFKRVPGAPIAYWLSEAMLNAFSMGKKLDEIGEPRQGLATADNGRFVRAWYEVSAGRIGFGLSSIEAAESKLKWFPYNKGGESRKWYGNQEFVVNWENDGKEIRSFGAESGKPRSRAQNTAYYFCPSLSWSKVGSGVPTFRYFPQGFIFDVAGTSIFAAETDLMRLAAVCNSGVARAMLAATSPTMNFEVGTLARLPVINVSRDALRIVAELLAIHRDDWNSREESADFRALGWCQGDSPVLSALVHEAFSNGEKISRRVQELEVSLNLEIAEAYGLQSELSSEVPISDVTLHVNASARHGAGRTRDEYQKLHRQECAADLISYAVACMFGRYSLDRTGLILADQGDTLSSYFAKIPMPSFAPDDDNVIPIVDGDWFEDDIVGRFRQFLRIAFGEQYFEDNIRFVIESLGVKNLREYFVKSFYREHVQRYKKRPIYWLFSSPKGSFNALIYLHRYTPSTVSIVLNEYLREFKAKLAASLQHQERLAVGGGTAREQAAALKEADRLRKVILELDEYEHDVLYPLASQRIAIDLDDGVKVNYPKFGTALKKIQGLEAAE